MQELDCIVATLKPTQAYYNILKPFLSEADTQVSLKELQVDTTALLLPAMADEAEADSYLTSHYQVLLQNELDDWDLLLGEDVHVDSYEKFLEYFTIEYHSVVLNLLAENITDDDDSQAVH